MTARAPLALLLAAWSAPALAQSDDAAYCGRLSDLAQRYLAVCSDWPGKPDLETSAAIEQCRVGNLAAGIPILERKLGERRVSLPRRS